MASLTTIVFLAGSVAVGGLSINGKIDRSSVDSVAPVSAAPTAKPRVVQVTGEDFKFDAPDIIPAGLTEF
ncbi:MAG TPA: hypothetical protein VGN73_10585, partial [Gemmatimonadaceae bacterium]|nr:hypothetical protein [Gemmatimonadaceae bacterium]